jgi:hypothetical protein
MKFAFPQDPSHAVNAMLRVDEAADTSSGQSNLQRQQDIAVVGQTVPLIFCNRHQWGTDVNGQEIGDNGGVWYSPRLIGLYPKALEANLLFLISSGEVEGLRIENVYYGYEKLETKTSDDYVINENGQVELDANGQPILQTVYPYFAYAYEAIPPGIDSVYQPGGSDELHIPNFRPRDEFKLNGYNFTTNVDCERLQIVIDGDLWSEKQGGIVQTNVVPTESTSQLPGYIQTGTRSYQQSYQAGPFYDHCPTPDPDKSQSIICNGRYETRYYTVTYPIYGPDPSWHNQNPSVLVEFYTYAIYQITIRPSSNSETSTPTYQNAFNLRIDGTSSFALPAIDLPPDEYRVEIARIEDGWNSDIVYKPVVNNPDQQAEIDAIVAERQNYTEAGKSPGRGKIEAEIQVTETIYNKIEYPEVPGGSEQTSGTFFDLTLAGIRGSIRALKPVDGSGPGYWVQTHMFVEQGVLVNRLMPSYFSDAEEEGASHYYADLINYLLGKAKMIKADQIDVESLKAACAIHEHYKIFYNGVMQLTTSFTEWLTRTAPYFLMTPRQVDGKYGIWPVVPVDTNSEFSREPIASYLTTTITADEIVSGSYSREYFPAKDRKDICLVMVYKDVPIANPGQTVTVEVRYRGTALQGPFEQHDLSEFCCHPNQALMSARYLLARRRYTSHRCSLAVGRRGAQLKPGDVIAVELEVDTTAGNGITDLMYYQVDAITEGQGGQVQLELIHFPTAVNDAGETISVIAREIHEGQVSVQ